MYLILGRTALAVSIALACFAAAFSSAASAATPLPTTVVGDFSVSITASSRGKAGHRKAMIASIRIGATGINALTPEVKCDSKKCKRVAGKGKFRTKSRAKSVTFSNVRWLLPRGRTLTVAVNRKGYLGRFKTLKLKSGSVTQFVAVRTGCTSKRFKPTPCPAPAPTKRCKRNASVQSGMTAAGTPSTTLASGDFDGDGRDDVAAAYNYSGNSVGLFRFAGQPTLAFVAPRDWTFDGTQDWNTLRVSSGDFDGDCISDVALLIDAGSGNIAVQTSKGSAQGLAKPTSDTWRSSSGSWPWANIRTLAGDYNGDGFDDLALLQHIGGGITLNILPGSSAGLGAPVPIWTGVGWDLALMDAVTVDYNGDGRDEIAAFHSRGTSLGVNLWLFPSAGVWLGEPKLGWVSDVSWDLTKIHAVAGDFDGDGLGDIELAYAPQSQQVRIYQLKGTGAGLNPPALAWDSGPGNWDLNAVKFASGDFNGDGKSDLTGLYNYGPGSARFWTFAGGTANPVESWFTPSGWEWDRVQ